MKRKINRVGPSTLTVSLPSKWAKNLGLKAGNEIEVEERANSLVISNAKSPEKKEMTIHIPSADRFLKRILATPYMKGYDSIKVTYDDPKIYTQVQETITTLLIGFEIVQHDRNTCILKNIADSIDDEYDQNQRKYFLQVKTVIHQLIDALEKQDEQELEHVLLLDQTIDKLHVFMRRILNTKGYKDDTKGKSLYYIINLLETISDRCRDIARRIKETKTYPSQNFIELLKLIEKNIEFYYDLFYNPKNEKFFEIKQREEMMLHKIIEQTKNQKPSDFLYYHCLLAIAELMHNLSEEMG